MLMKISTLFLLITLMLPMAATAGDPLDTNDGPKIIIMSSVDVACDTAAQYPQCNPCWTSCLYAIMAEAWADGNWDWGF